MTTQNLATVLSALPAPFQGYQQNEVFQGAMYILEGPVQGLELRTRECDGSVDSVSIYAASPIMHTGNFPWANQAELEYLADQVDRKFPSTGIVILKRMPMVTLDNGRMQRPRRVGESLAPYENRVFGVRMDKPSQEGIALAINDTYLAARLFVESYAKLRDLKQGAIDSILAGRELAMGLGEK